MPHIKIDDVGLHYTVTGDGPPLFLSFCLGGNLGMWGPEIEVLASKFAIVLRGPRGHGGTSRPSDPGAYGVAQSTREELKKISVPALVLAGENDPAQAVSHCDFKRIPGAGHLSSIDQPERFADAIVEFAGQLS